MPRKAIVMKSEVAVPLDVCLDVAGVMILFLDPDGQVRMINRRGCEILGYSEEEIVGRNWFTNFVPRQSRRRVRGIFRKLLGGHGDEVEYVDGSVLAAGGDERTVRWHNAVVEVDGEVIGTLSSGMDLTEHEEAEAALRESEARTRAILETTVDAIITADERGHIDSFNPAAESMFGYRKHEVIGRNLSMLMPVPYRLEHDRYMEAYLSTGERKIIGIGREVVARRKDGSTFPIDLSVSEFETQGRRMFTGVVRDISERRELEQEVLRISEEERERIGRDLHDSLGSLLTGTAMGLHALIARRQRGESIGSDDLERVAQMIDEGARQAHALSRGLNPVHLESDGLIAALAEMTGSISVVVDAVCTLEVDQPVPSMSQPVATQLYRIAQEAVNNAVKHADASRITVEITTDEGHLKLVIRDNGKGITTSSGTGMGMHIMPHRARLINGVFSMDGSNGGTTVTCAVPLDTLDLLQ